MKSSLFGSEEQSASFVLIELHLKRYLSAIFNKYLRNSVRCLETYIRRTHRGHFFVSWLWRRLDLPFPNMQRFLSSAPARREVGNRSQGHPVLLYVSEVMAMLRTHFCPQCANTFCSTLCKLQGRPGLSATGRSLQFMVLPLHLGHALFARWPRLTLAVKRRARLVQGLRCGRRHVGDGPGNNQSVEGNARAAPSSGDAPGPYRAADTPGGWAEPTEGVHGRLQLLPGTKPKDAPGPSCRARLPGELVCPRLWDAVKPADRLEMPARPGVRVGGQGRPRGYP